MKNLPPLLTRPATLAVAAILSIALILAASGNGSTTTTPAAPNAAAEHGSVDGTDALLAGRINGTKTVGVFSLPEGTLVATVPGTRVIGWTDAS